MTATVETQGGEISARWTLTNTTGSLVKGEQALVCQVKSHMNVQKAEVEQLKQQRKHAKL